MWQSVHYFIEALVLQKAGLTPNVIEQLKYLTSCLKKLGQAIDLNEAGSGKLPEVIDYLISIIKRSEIDITFRKYVRF